MRGLILKTEQVRQLFEYLKFTDSKSCLIIIKNDPMKFTDLSGCEACTNCTHRLPDSGRWKTGSNLQNMEYVS